MDREVYQVSVRLKTPTGVDIDLNEDQIPNGIVGPIDKGDYDTAIRNAKYFYRDWFVSLSYSVILT